MRIGEMSFAFVVLLFFFVAPIAAMEGSQSLTGTESTAHETQVKIDSDGQLFLDGTSVDHKQLNSFIDNHPDGKNAVIVVMADEKVSANEVLRVMNICCNHKISKVKLIYTPAWNHKG